MSYFKTVQFSYGKSSTEIQGSTNEMFILEELAVYQKRVKFACVWLCYERDTLQYHEKQVALYMKETKQKLS